MAAQLIHPAKRRQRIDRRVERQPAKLAIRALDVEEDPFGLGPTRVWTEVEAAKPDTVLSTDTFGWRVLQTLADDVEVLHTAAAEGRRATVGIRLDKSAGDVPR